ncbi:MAG TPA: ATP-binding protein [Acidimicrobiales bacterium]|nr:ATP-binding protein [Acidimicrobiales bacterium]
MERVVLQGLATFRWAAWVWMVVVLFVGRDDLARPEIAYAAVATALAMCAWATSLLHARPKLLLDRRVVVVELLIGATLIVLDGVVSDPNTMFTTRQSLGSAWPFTGILGAGIAGGPIVGALAGAALGVARVVAVAVNETPLSEAGRVMSLLNATVFYALTGTVAGYLVRRLMRDEEAIANANARAEVARTLHDGVLQTLALVERRVDDPALARLARDTERDLRDFLAGTAPPSASVDLATNLRRSAARCEDQFGVRVSVVVADDTPALSTRCSAALLGAVGEALANTGKHAEASTVTVYVEPQSDGVFCSVRDDGRGFDPAASSKRMGLRESIRGRIEAVGGRAEVRSQPGEGTEVCVWLP